MKTIDPRYTILAVVLIAIILAILIATREPPPPTNPFDTPAGRKTAQNLRDARGW